MVKLKKKKATPKAKITIAIGKPMTGEPMDYSKMPKKAKGKGKC